MKIFRTKYLASDTVKIVVFGWVTSLYCFIILILNIGWNLMGISIFIVIMGVLFGILPALGCHYIVIDDNAITIRNPIINKTSNFKYNDILQIKVNYPEGNRRNIYITIMSKNGNSKGFLLMLVDMKSFTEVLNILNLKKIQVVGYNK